MSTLKKVSVVMCTYNGEQYIQEQLDSILAQTYPLYEIIIQDDGSTDSTCQILQQYQSQYPIIHLTHNTGIHGVNNNFFSALRLASGDYIAISDQDDIWMPSKIEKQVAVLESGAMLCYHPTPSFVGEDKEHSSYDKRIPTNAYPRFLVTGCMTGHTTLFRKELLDYLFGHLDDAYLASLNRIFFYDSILDMTLLTKWEAVYLNEPLSLHRRLVTSASMTNVKYNQRSILNALRQIAHTLKPTLRRKYRPILEQRWTAMRVLLEHFPEAKDRTAAVVAMIDSYYIGSLSFVVHCIKNKDGLFMTRENNPLIATARAILFPLMMYNYFDNGKQ